MVDAADPGLDLAAAGIPTQVVVANQVIPAAQATNAFFRNRRAMQIKYLDEIERRFRVPVFVLPLMEKEIRGLPAVEQAASLLFTEPVLADGGVVAATA